jgi:2-methylcitrate dehydratase PrpD
MDRPVSPRAAATINGVGAHAHNFDDTHDRAVLHAGVSVIPAALAVAEATGASGRALLDAVVFGYDVHVRVALAATQAPGHSGWHYTSTCGVFGASAAAGRLLGLDEHRMANALGIAQAQAAGTLQSEHDGSWTKRLQPGLAAAGGILAAQLASRGFRGPQEALEGRFDFYRVYLQAVDTAPVLDSPGKRFEVARCSLKPYPTCRFTHAPAAAPARVSGHGPTLRGIPLGIVLDNRPAGDVSYPCAGPALRPLPRRIRSCVAVTPRGGTAV